MAEYAGLEIRIGGNTTKLTNALKASTKSAAELQRGIRQATRAMQFDPKGIKNVETRVRLTGDRMQSLQSKAQLVRDAMQQLGDTMTSVLGKNNQPQSVRDLASETENLSLKAKQADERFNGLTGTLAKIYESWNRLTRDEGVDLAKSLGIDAKTAERLMSSKTTLTELRSELSLINKERAQDISGSGPKIISREQMEQLERLKSFNFHDMFGQGLNLDTAIEQAKDLGVAIEDSAISNVRELQKTFKEAQDEKKAFDDALSFEQMGTDLQRIESEAESLSQTMRTLDDGLTVATKGGAFQGLEGEIRKVDSALENVNRDIERTEQAMQVDPGNIELAARHFNDLQQKAALSEEKVTLLDRELRLLDVNGVTKAAEGHKDLAKWVEESAESARLAQKELSEQQATVANLSDQYATLKQTISNMKGDATLATYSDGVLRWKRATQELSDAMASLEKQEGKVAEEQQNLERAQGNFDKATREADEYKAKLEELKGEYQRLTQAFEQGDTSLDFVGAMQRIGELEGEISEVDVAYMKAKRSAEKFAGEVQERSTLFDGMNNDLQKARTGVGDLAEAVKKLESTKEVRLLQNPTGEIEKAEAELTKLGSEVDKAKAKEKELSDAYDSAKSENELAKTAQAAREVSANMDEAKASAMEANEALKVKGDSILNASTVKSIGMTLSATVTPALSALGYKMVDASSTVDSAYRDMRKTVEGTEEQFQHLKESATEFSRTHVTSADQILQIEAIGGELGIATENLETFAEVISNIDVATNLDVEGAADALGHLANILHLTEEDYVGFSDALVRLGNNGASTETEIANIAERIGSMGSIVDMSGSDILAWASTIASTGQNAEAAGTAISKTMSFMETAVAAAGGTLDSSFESIDAAVKEGGDRLTVFASLAGMTADEFTDAWETGSEDMAATMHDQLEAAKGDLQMIADVAHMSADDFAMTWESDPTAALEAFIRGLNDIEGAEGSADKVLTDLGITATRQKQAIQGLMQTIDGLDDNLEMSRNAWNGISDEWGEAGDAANEAQKKAEGFSGQMQILKNLSQNFLSELGEGAAPWIQRFSGIVSTLSESFSSLSKGTKETIVGFGGFAAALGPVLSVGATFATAKGEFDDWLNTAASGTAKVKAVFASGGEEAVKALTGTMTTMEKVKLVGAELGTSLLKGLGAVAVVAAIGLIASELMKLYQRYKEHIAATEGLTNALNGIGAASEYAAGGIGDAKTSIGELLADSREADGRLADLTKTIEDSNSQYGTFAGQMDYYASAIAELGGKSELTEDEAYRLSSALLAVNDACGTTYGLDEYGNIIDTETGKIQDNTQTILDNIDARKQQAMVDYYSDDYAKAASEWAEAQDKLNDAQQAYNDLTSDAGMKEYLDRAKEVYGAQYDNAKVQAAYNKEVSDAKEAMDNYQSEVSRAEEAMGVLEGKIGAANEELGQHKAALEEAARAQEEMDRRSEAVTADVSGNFKRMSDAASELGKSDEDFNSIVDRFDALHVSAEELNDVDLGGLMSAFDESMGSAVAKLEEGGVHMDTWNAALEQAPGAAENMGSVTAAAFDSMYQIASGNLNDTMTLIGGLETAMGEVDGQEVTFYIGDNGSIIDSQGKVYDLERDIGDIPDEVITAYTVNDADARKKLTEAKRELKGVDSQKTSPTITAKDKATQTAKSVKGLLTDLGRTNPSPIISARDYANGTINGVRNNLSRLDGNSATVTIYQRTKQSQATGGVNTSPVIPKHASGYIATGPTMTNQGWIGEDGVEAVANWATGGAVVPLTNKRYMLPIADAIADGMSRRRMDAKPSITINVTAQGDPSQIADAIANRVMLLGL